MIRTAVCYLLLATVVGSGGVWAQSASLGPLAVREVSPLYGLFYVPTGEVADVLPAAATGFETSFFYSNVFERSTVRRYDVYLDVERLNSVFAVRRGLGRGLEIGGRVSFHSDWGGFLDPVVEGLHNVFGLPNGDREKEPYGNTVLELTENGRELWASPIHGLAVEDVQLFGKWELVRARSGVLSLRTTVELPVSAEGAGTRLTDLGVELLARRSWEPWHFHGLLGWTTARAPAWARPIADPGALLFMAALERELGDLSLLAQFATSGKYLENTGVSELDDRPALLAVGIAGRREHWRWELGFVEDVPPNSPSVDFTFHFRLRRTWP